MKLKYIVASLIFTLLLSACGDETGSINANDGSNSDRQEAQYTCAMHPHYILRRSIDRSRVDRPLEITWPSIELHRQLGQPQSIPSTNDTRTLQGLAPVTSTTLMACSHLELASPPGSSRVCERMEVSPVGVPPHAATYWESRTGLLHSTTTASGHQMTIMAI